MKQVFIVTLLVLLVSGVSLADGPETGTVTGQVTDAQGGGLPGVRVTLTGERGSQTTFSGDNGAWRFALLVPGGYTVKAELESFQTAEGVASVTAGKVTGLTLKMILGTAEEITVTSEAPMVDKYNVTAGTTVAAEIGVQTAGTTRTYYGLINTLPGVASDPENDDIQQTRPSVNGTHFADNSVFIDGVDTTFAKFGGSRVFLPTTAITEVTMEAGGSSAEYGRAVGSSTNVIVKSGTNRFHYDALVQHQKVKWGADNKEQPAIEQRETTPLPRNFLKKNQFQWESDNTGYEASIGGPFRKDKAWFFVGYSKFNDNYVEQGLGGDPIDTSLKNEATIIKLNFQPGAKHQLSGSYIDTPASRVYFIPQTFDYWTPTPHVVDGDLATLNWNYSISSNLFLETKVAAQTSTEHKQLACGSVIEEVCLALKAQDLGPDGVGDPGEPFGGLRFPRLPEMGEHWPGNNYRVYLDSEFLSAWHNGWILSDGYGNNDFPRDQFNMVLTQFAGQNHEMKYGYDFQNTQWTGESQRPGLYSGPNYTSFNPFGYEGAGGLPVNFGGTNPDACGTALRGAGLSRTCVYYDYNADFLTSNEGSGNSETEVHALFVRDRFSYHDKWFFNLGFRVEDQNGTNDVGREVFADSYISPRASATYDIKGNGKMLASLNVGRYHALLNQEWIAQHLHDQWNGFNGSARYIFCDAYDVLLASGVFGSDFGLGASSLNGVGCNAGVGYNLLYAAIAPGRMFEMVDQGIFNSDITPYYKDEIIVGFEWQFTRNWAMDVKYINWEMKNLIGSTTQQGPNGEQFEFTANYSDYGSLLQTLEDVRIANGTGARYTPGVLDNFVEGSNEFQALQVQFNRRYDGGWAWYNNISWSETETSGAGAWWNNTNSSYGEDLGTTLQQFHIDQCNLRQTRPAPASSRTHPVDCSVLVPFIGQPVSMVNRLAPNRNTDRPIIFNSFGYKVWNFGKLDLTAGGHLTWQSGLPWGRSEGVAAQPATGPAGTFANSSVTLRIHPLGEGNRRSNDEFTLNVTTALGFPLGFKQLRGEVRVEVLNITDAQQQRLVTSQGEARPTTRDYQRPRQMRVNLSFRW